MSPREQANKDTKDKLDSIEKKVDHNTKQAVKVNEEKVKPIEKKVCQISVKIGRLEKVHLKNKQEKGKPTGAYTGPKHHLTRRSYSYTCITDRTNI